MSRLSNLTLLFCFVLACTGCQSEPPNIVLISIDTLRWDYLGAYGYEEPEISPNINWLAGNGTVFEQAVASAGTTIPSHGTMLTGLYPRQHGARSNHHGLYPKTDTIARALSDAGYQTGAFMSVRFMPKSGKLNRGFQSDNMAYLEAQRGWHPQSGDETLAQMTSWLDSEETEEPLFLFLHFWESHTPFDPTEWARSRMGDYTGFLRDGVTVEHMHQNGEEIKQSPEHIAAMRTLYAGEVNQVDSVVGDFLKIWGDRGLLDNSVVIFTADHGEALGENRRLGHGPTHNEFVLRVPLIIADFRSPEARRVTTRVGTIDIAATIADLANLEGGFDVNGYSLLDHEKLDPEKPYFAEVALKTSRDAERHTEEAWYDPNALAVWVGGLKLISQFDNQTFEETFPDNRQPIPADAETGAIMLNYMSGLIDSFREAELDWAQDEVPEDVVKELQGLGYVQ